MLYHLLSSRVRERRLVTAFFPSELLQTLVPKITYRRALYSEPGKTNTIKKNNNS
jgi:hypothetical protein